MVILLVIDMQVGLFGEATPRFDAEGVIHRINSLAEKVRAVNGEVVFVQHDSQPGGTLEPGTEGWSLLPSLNRLEEDLIVRKRACDAFYETGLEILLNEREPKPLIITGCATDFCVDTTVRAAASRDYNIIVVEDGHTTADRPHLNAEDIIQHHNWIWKGLILPHNQVKVLPTAAILEQIGS
jgi:nicotinamidase-related amidase